MSYNLVVVESPGKIDTLTDIMNRLFPGQQWLVKACYGHFRDLPGAGLEEGDLVTGIGSDLEPKYELTDRGAPTIANLRKLVREADHTYLASDGDREGEAIAWHLYEELRLRPQDYSRIVFSTIDDSGLSAALGNVRKIDMPMVRAQEGRRSLDRIVGYMVSPELRRQSGENLSAGRVQSVAVLLVVLREQQRRRFVPVKHFSARLNFVEPNGSQWSADWLSKPDFVNEQNPYITDQNVVLPLTSIKRMQVLSYDEKPAKRNPKAPFITTTLQQAASNALGISPKKTMELAQKLFDAGKISYMRTDNPNVAESAVPAIQAVLAAKGIPGLTARRKFKGKDDAQEAHPGVTPVYWHLETAGETAEEQALYKLIRDRALASQAEHATYMVREVVLEHPTAKMDGKPIRFGARGRTLVSAGFLKLLSTDDTEEDQKEEAPNPIPELSEGALVTPKSGELVPSTTQAPPRYTEATLVQELERNGIGRPSTYAAILENITGKSYILPDLEDKSRQGKQPFFYPTPIGVRLIVMMAGKFRFLDINFTRELEKELDDIAKGRTTYTEVVGKLYRQVSNEIATLAGSVPSFVKEVKVFKCECGGELYHIKKHGFWGCKNHPACNFTYPDKNGEPGKRNKPVELSEFMCGTCNSPLRNWKKAKSGTKKGYNFWGCSVKTCTQTYPNVKNEGRPDYKNGKTS